MNMSGAVDNLTSASYRPFDCFSIIHRPHYVLDIQFGQRASIAGFPHQNAHRLTTRQKFAYNVITQKAGGAGHQCQHFVYAAFS